MVAAVPRAADVWRFQPHPEVWMLVVALVAGWVPSALPLLGPLLMVGR